MADATPPPSLPPPLFSPGSDSMVTHHLDQLPKTITCGPKETAPDEWARWISGFRSSKVIKGDGVITSKIIKANCGAAFMQVVGELKLGDKRCDSFQSENGPFAQCMVVDGYIALVIKKNALEIERSGLRDQRQDFRDKLHLLNKHLQKLRTQPGTGAQELDTIISEVWDIGEEIVKVDKLFDAVTDQMAAIATELLKCPLSRLAHNPLPLTFSVSFTHIFQAGRFYANPANIAVVERAICQHSLFFIGFISAEQLRLLDVFVRDQIAVYGLINSKAYL
ncbi:hypothetical protein N7495_004684 [Penicillium taxi]|uniref:uncharacterized protein n=1 Tax=Penicillium taxi TaxID=168475 RepID=UPI002545AE70|nr:uncharacterized protein N7495_004684 [Penicillium taxi]KAJ5899940.1 hypothetical protein N7495_004684 [Penicillium taxi]